MLSSSLCTFVYSTLFWPRPVETKPLVIMPACMPVGGLFAMAHSACSNGWGLCTHQ